MITPIDLQNERVFAYRLSGEVTQEELQPWMRVLDDKIAQQGKLRLYIEYQGIEGTSPAAIWEDLKFDLTHLTDFDKAAIVTDKNWLDLTSGLINLLTGIEVKTFSFEQQEEARQWIKAD